MYPGSLLGWIIYDDIKAQPRLTQDFINISSNHLYVFIIISIIGLFTYVKPQEFKFLILYLIFSSIFLEILHLFIEARTFQFSDLLGNLLGVIIVIIIHFILKNYGFFKN